MSTAILVGVLAAGGVFLILQRGLVPVTPVLVDVATIGSRRRGHDVTICTPLTGYAQDAILRPDK
jgi:hypothetical protein